MYDRNGARDSSVNFLWWTAIDKEDHRLRGSTGNLDRKGPKVGEEFERKRMKTVQDCVKLLTVKYVISRYPKKNLSPMGFI